MDISSPDELADDNVSETAQNTTTTVLDKIQILVEDALEAGQPLELEPHRGKVFTVFADAHAQGWTTDDGPLSPDTLTRELGQRWGLDQSAQQSVAQQQKLGETDLAKMRALWSTLRLWMEWTYAWDRWNEFHK